MSCFFEFDDETVWNPSNATARLYVDYARAMENFCGVASGVGEIVDDECRVDVPAFREFVESALAMVARSKSAVVHSLADEFLVVSAVMLDRVNVHINLPGGLEAAKWRQRVSEMAVSMPR